MLLSLVGFHRAFRYNAFILAYSCREGVLNDEEGSWGRKQADYITPIANWNRGKAIKSQSSSASDILPSARLHVPKVSPSTPSTPS